MEPQSSARWGSVPDESVTPRGFFPKTAEDVEAVPSGNSDFCGYPNATLFVTDLRKKLGGAVNISEKLPQGDMNYLVCSTYEDFLGKVSIGSSQVTVMMKNLSHYWGVPGATCRQFENPQNKTAIMQGIQETTKQLKERMDLTLDELARLKDEQSSSQNGIPGVQDVNLTQRKVRFVGRATQIARPQVTFAWKIDNSRSPFLPRISVKQNALRSLEMSMTQLREDDGRAPHPYQFELDLFQPGEPSFVAKPAIPAGKMEDSPFAYVDNLEDFRKSLLELSSVKELAIDLEHHSYRTYLGITCLIQISSRTKDYIFDSILLRDHLHELNALFTNPSILKVFHGGNSDIQWLQRDFGVYVVNMFDTGQASRVLQLPRFSLAFLVQHYLGRIVDKTHQMSDWRIRPIPADMLAYARSDTHDLLYLYDCVRNDLIKKDPGLSLLHQVYAQSKSICLQRYEKQTMDVNDFALIMWRFAKNFSEQQKFALKRILEWRDGIARDLDESIGFVLPTKACVDLAEELPRTADDLVKALEFVPVVLKQRIHQMLELLREARAFTGVVPVPAAQNYAPMEVDTHEVIQRKSLKPLTAEDFSRRHFIPNAPPRSSELIWTNRNQDVKGIPEDPEKARFAHIWMHFQAVSVAEEEAEKAKPRHSVEKPNVKVSIPMELPLAEVVIKSAKNDIQQSRKEQQSVVSEKSATTDKGTGSYNSAAPSSGGTALNSRGAGRSETIASTSDSVLIPSKRPAFDYHSADYSKFSVGAHPAQNRQAGKQHPGGLKDPNKSFNKQRNLSSGNSARPSGSVGGKFRKPA